MSTEPAAVDRVSVFYDAIAAFQRTHRLPSLQHAQLRGLLAEHLARTVPVPSADQTTERAAEPVCKFDQGCHRVAPCEPGCGAPAAPLPADRAAVLTLTRTQLSTLLAHHADVLAASLHADARSGLPELRAGVERATELLTLHANAMTADEETPAVAELLDSAFEFPEWLRRLAAEAPTTTQPETEACADRDTLRRKFGDVLRHWGLLDEQIDQKAAEEYAVTDLLSLLPEQTSRDAEIEHLRDRLASCRERVGIAADKAIAAEDAMERARLARRRLTSALIAVEPLLTKPYPDDPHWTPWTRFVGPALKELSDALRAGPAANDEPAAGVGQDGAQP